MPCFTPPNKELSVVITDIYKNAALQQQFLYVLYHINSFMNEHYKKYNETIKKVSRRNYRKRIILLNEYLADKSCAHCGESETVCRKFHPHDAEIRKITKRVGTNDKSRSEVFTLINESTILCSNCFIKMDHDLIEFI